MDAVINLAVQSLYLVFILSMPPIIVASVVGLLVSLIQAITQLQEQTLTFGIKLIAVAGALALMGGWIGGELLRYSETIFNSFHLI